MSGAAKNTKPQNKEIYPALCGDQLLKGPDVSVYLSILARYIYIKVFLHNEFSMGVTFDNKISQLTISLDIEVYFSKVVS